MSSKIETSAFYEQSEDILDMCREKGIVLFSAPTGSGKTTGMKKLVEQNPDIFGRTVMVQPTKMASQTFQDSAMGMIMRTPIPVLETFYRCGSFRCDTFILDEVHTQSVEYAAILQILRVKNLHLKIRIILMSATPDVESFEELFPSLRVMMVPVQSPFPIDIQYHKIPAPVATFINHRCMLPLIEEQLANRLGHERILIFVYTHEQCDRLVQDLKKSSNVGVKSYLDRDRENIRSLHGGFSEEERQEWNRFLRERKRSIIIATNVAETSITIPGVSLVIDFGIRCIQMGTRIIYDLCPRSNLEQRAGRTGRTCPGVVVRMMSEEDYHARPYQGDHEYNWDIVILRMLKHRVPMDNLIPNNVHVHSILERFVHYGVLDGRTRHLNQDMTRFILDSPLLFKNSCRLFDFLSKKRSESMVILYAMVITIIDAFEAKMIRIYYYSRETTKMNRNQYLSFLQSRFCSEKDELELMLNIYMSCALSEDAFQLAKAYSLNFRSIRQITGHIHKTMAFISKYQKKELSEWKTTVHNLCITSSVEKDLENKHQYLLFIRRSCMNAVQYEFMVQSTVPLVMSASGLMYRENLYPDYRNCITTPVYQTRRSPDPVNRGILLFTMDDVNTDDLPVDWASPNVFLETPVEVAVCLFTRLPDDLPRDIPKLAMSGYWERCERLECIMENKELFSHSIREIEQDVAFRPMKWACMENFKKIEMWLTRTMMYPLSSSLVESACAIASGWDGDKADSYNAGV